MQKTSIVMTEQPMIAFIKDLLSLSKGGSWHHQTMTKETTILFKGNNKVVQKAIHDWLTIPERRKSFGGYH